MTNHSKPPIRPTGIDHIVLRCARLQETLQFYQRVLGCHLHRVDDTHQLWRSLMLDQQRQRRHLLAMLKAMLNVLLQHVQYSVLGFHSFFDQPRLNAFVIVEVNQ